MCKFLYEYKFSLPWGEFQEVQLEGCMRAACLFLKEITKLFSRVAVSFYIPTSIVYKECSFSILAPESVLSVFYFSHSVGMEQYLTVVLFCISLM